jgi:SAM-dependent methyltransferase
MSTDWYKDWFNSPYYHILYKHRDDTEAQGFLDRLTAYLKINSSQKILDLACGRGRHSVYLNKKGFKVMGVDLSEENISFANKNNSSSLSFAIHDMRQPIDGCSFEIILNLFTSFGYFEEERDNLLVLQSMKKMLAENGLIVIDFLNSCLIQPGEKETQIDGISFFEKKTITNRWIIKEISVEDNSQVFHFAERVRKYTLDDFYQMCGVVGLKINCTFGNYYLDSYNIDLSERLIMIISHD